MKGDRLPGKMQIKGTGGFTLFELMVVLVIAGILATGVVFMFSNPSSKVKNQSFSMLGEFNLARSEAVSQNVDALITLLPGATDDDQDGYRIWIDENGDSAYTAGTDTLIRETYFPQKVQYYDPTVLPIGGPSTTPGGGNLIGGNGIVLDDDTTIASFFYEPDGTLQDAVTEAISVVIFAPKGSHEEIHGTPYAVTISNSSGRVRTSRWTEAGTWGRK